jgi:phosphopentomutase
MKRAIILVMDGFGCGEQADSATYGDSGANTLKHIAEHINPLPLPNLNSLGLYFLDQSATIKPKHTTGGAFAKMREYSPGKDSVTGHWEIAGIHLDQPFPIFEHGFDESILGPFKAKTGRGVLGNKPASGTAIIKELGEEHLATGDLIVYTSADSVFQIAANEAIVPVEELYEYCEVAREILRGKNEVGRVIARPFVGTSAENFTRTKYRKDYSVVPTSDSIFDLCVKAGIPTVGIGKIDDLFGSKGIQHAIKSKGNRDCIKSTFDALKEYPDGLIMINLVDFDMVFGHQRDVQGYYDELITFDAELGELLGMLTDDDMLFITSDHGNDPTHQGTDHTREHVPLLVYSPKLKAQVDLGTRSSFADVGQTIAELFGLDQNALCGESFLNELH